MGWLERMYPQRVHTVKLVAMVVVLTAAAHAEPPRQDMAPRGRTTVARVDLLQPTGNFGGRTADEVLRVAKMRLGVFRACYQKELNRKQKFGGKLVLRFEVDPQGVVTMTKLAGSTVNDATVESCLLLQIARSKFKPASDAQISLPMLLIPETPR